MNLSLHLRTPGPPDTVSTSPRHGAQQQRPTVLLVLPPGGGQFEIHRKQQLRTSHTFLPPVPQRHSPRRSQHARTSGPAARRPAPQSWVPSSLGHLPIPAPRRAPCGRVRNPNTLWGSQTTTAEFLLGNPCSDTAAFPGKSIGHHCLFDTKSTATTEVGLILPSKTFLPSRAERAGPVCLLHTESVTCVCVCAGPAAGSSGKRMTRAPSLLAHSPSLPGCEFLDAAGGERSRREGLTRG